MAGLESDRSAILRLADAMLRDDNFFFEFPNHTRDLDRVWEFDPIEKRYWPRRHYTERKLHDRDTPHDAKIVFEINRFKDLPILGQAALLTGEKKYAAEVERRLLSWIEGNPFASTVNWSSALEISIRIIAWTTTLLLLKKAGFPTSEHPKIARSIYEQILYLSADLSTDRVVPINHLIGEATGLFAATALWEFTEAERYAAQARRILEREIIRQTFPDGVTREASSCYHQFVTHFFDLADRIATSHDHPFSQQYKVRLSNMKSFLESMTMDSQVVRFGDADDGWALWLEGDRDAWKSFLFGPASTLATKPLLSSYPSAQIVAAHLPNAFLFLRAGAFGMGGSGFSSHAHDDFLSPIIYLAGRSILTDSGTFVYNGNPAARDRYRLASSHNGLVVLADGELPPTGPKPRANFGWELVRPDAMLLGSTCTTSNATATAQYGEWPQHRRSIKIRSTSALIVDRFLQLIPGRAEWSLHLAPEWTMDTASSSSLNSGSHSFRNASGDRLCITLHGKFDPINIEPYDFSLSYRVSQSATMMKLSASNPAGLFAILMTIDRAQ